MDTGAKVGLGLFALVLILTVAFVGCERIGAGHVGLKIDLAGSQRGVEQLPIRTGWVFYFRPSSQVVEYPTYMQTAKWTANPHEGDNPDSPNGANEEISFNDSQGLTIKADISLSYQLIEKDIPAFYVKFRSDDIKRFTHGYLRNETRNAFNEISTKYHVEEIMGPKNAQVIKEVEALIQQRTLAIGVHVEQLGFINAIRPPEIVQTSITAKANAQQLALQKQNEIVQAQAEAAKEVARAEGDAKATLTRAQGQAQANKLLADSMSANLLESKRIDLQWHWIDRWDGSRAGTEINTGNGMLFQIPHNQ